MGSRTGLYAEAKKILPLSGIEPRFSSPYSSYCIDWNIPDAKTNELEVRKTNTLCVWCSSIK